MTDEQLASLAKQGDYNAELELFNKYRNVINKFSRGYFLIGGDVEDLIQEGMIGLYKAIINFDPKKNVSFKTFASTCIRHQLQSAIKVSSSEKNKILSSAISISDSPLDEEDGDLEIFIPSSLPSPDDKVLEKERFKEIKDKIIDTLSALELKVLSLYLKGYSYQEISSLGGLSKKSIDNALTRIKNKLAFLKNN